VSQSCWHRGVFVGKNEAGKSAVFRGLSKLNPSDGEKYDGLKEFPRKLYTDEFKQQDWPVASGKFLLEEAEKTELEAMCSFLKDVREVTCTRHYSWNLEIEFGKDLNLPDISKNYLLGELDKIKKSVEGLTGPEGKGDDLKKLKDKIVAHLEQKKDQIQKSNPNLEQLKQIFDVAISTVRSNTTEVWQKELIDSSIRGLEKILTEIEQHQTLDKAKKWAEDKLPQFIYFGKYDVIDSAVYLPTFVTEVATSQKKPRVRTTYCLFRHVGLDIAKFAGLAQQKNPNQKETEELRRQVDERAILASSASNAMTNKFADWYEQRQHKFRYQVDGDYFRIWVSDDLDPSEIELDQRSLGMQYFFSFFTVFLVEAKEEHRESILLLDEPALCANMTGTLPLC